MKTLYLFLFLFSTSAFAEKCQTTTCLQETGKFMAEIEQAAKEHGHIIFALKNDILAHLDEYPDLTVEEAFCIVSRGLNVDVVSSKRCELVIRRKFNYDSNILQNKMIYKKYQIVVLKQTKDGGYVNEVDENGMWVIDLKSDNH